MRRFENFGEGDLMSEIAISDTHFQGVITPLVLPLLPDETADFDSLEQLLEFQIASGADGFWLNGTSGEFYGLRDDERVEVIKVAKRCIGGRAKIIGHVGQSSTRRVLEHAEAILNVGVDALALVPPFYIPHSQTELINHFCRISEELNQPLFLYHVPSMCKKSLSYENILRLAEEGVLIGLKDSAGDMQSLATLILDAKYLNFTCLNGNSGNLGNGFILGAQGFAGAIANVLPAKCKLAYDAGRAGDSDELKKIQAFITETFAAINKYPHKASFTWLNKWILKELGVIQHDTVIRPYDRLDAAGEEYMRDNLLPRIRSETPAVSAA
jgi:4-hydroxy-tetrahydrodipicolinate synthase